MVFGARKTAHILLDVYNDEMNVVGLSQLRLARQWVISSSSSS